MIIVSYDISNNKLRSQFSKYLLKKGRRLQYSVFEIKNSPRVLNNILKEVQLKYKPRFSNADSVIILSMCKACEQKVYRLGSLVQEEKEIVFF